MKNLLAFAFLLLTAGAAMAQPTTPPGVAIVGGTAVLAVTATTGNIALPGSSAFNAITLVNTGTKDAFIAQGGSSVVATTGSIPVRAGKHITIAVQGTYLAAICGGTDTTSLDIYQANGSVQFGP